MNNVKFMESNTEKLLINSFACKAQTGCKYNFYAEIASKEGYELIAKIFRQTAEHEFMHAKLFFNHLENAKDGKIDCQYSYTIGSTEENLYYSIQEEEFGCQEVYKNAEKTALEEGFDSIASTFKHVRNAESYHLSRFRILYQNIKNNTFFDKESEHIWVCQRCGYCFEDRSAPNFCPNCYAPKSYFEIMCQKY